MNKPFALLAALVVATVSSPSSTHAHAATVDYKVLIWVERVDRLSSFDTLSAPDFYADLWIDGVHHRTNTIDDNPHIEPHWVFNVGKTSDELLNHTIPLRVRIMDHDPIDANDQADIDPDAGRDLNLQLRFTDPDDDQLAGTLADADTGAELGVLRPVNSSHGQHVGWQSMPRNGPIRGLLTTEGTEHNYPKARVTYRVAVRRAPDFRVGGITSDGGGHSFVQVFNDGGPGTLTSVGCWRDAPGAGGAQRTVDIDMAGDGASTTVEVSVMSGSLTCEVAGKDWFGGVEPHTDNNTRHAFVIW